MQEHWKCIHIFYKIYENSLLLTTGFILCEFKSFGTFSLFIGKLLITLLNSKGKLNARSYAL